MSLPVTTILLRKITTTMSRILAKSHQHHLISPLFEMNNRLYMIGVHLIMKLTPNKNTPTSSIIIVDNKEGIYNYYLF